MRYIIVPGRHASALVSALSLFMWVSAGCGDGGGGQSGSGGQGGSGAQGGSGGSGAQGGSAGQGGQGGTGGSACISCNDYVMQGGNSTYLCDVSAPLVKTLEECMCAQGVCDDVCTQEVCVANLIALDTKCGDCVEQKCADEYAACTEDND